MHLIAPATRKMLIEREIQALGPENRLLAQGDFEVYRAKAVDIPHILPEIGRLREITFRLVGEGTGQERDLDHYDQYFTQLIIWDKINQCIVGGYRLGRGDKILKQHGLKGFYIHSLFEIKEDFSSVLGQSIELGRSYIIQEYQKKRLPLFLLWKGILYFLLKFPDYRYLIGPVSISKFYSDLSKSLIITFVRKYFYNPEFAEMINPRTPYVPNAREVDLEKILDDLDNTLESLEGFIETIEPKHIRLPILLKQYIRQNARFIGFNLDPNFNDALDGLIILDLEEVRQETVENLKRAW